MITNVFNGFCMALADSVPGVSGGTIAFILGFYEDLLESVNNITTGNKEKFKESIIFLAKLFIGWVVGMTLSVLFLSSMFEKNIYFLSSLFMGLTAASIIYIIKSEFKVIDKKNKYLLFSILGIVIVVLISALRGKLMPSGNMELSNLNFLEYIYIFFTGMIAISAMVLPGISGSTLLLIFGVYIPVINALNQLLRFDFSVFTGLLIFSLGILCGFVVSVRIIRHAFRKHRSKMIYLIVGLTIGSLFAIVQGPTTLVVPKAAVSLSTFSPFGFIVGVALLLLLELFKNYSIKKISENDTDV
ncbi:MAG: DUF368 domain-containing protein [Peptostreptococcus sp.]|uniref:DUF368 domain-containing protein n=1 Tax=Peptostreptococcus sp. TaxID=1262 RepID=UPI002FC7EA1C